MFVGEVREAMTGTGSSWKLSGGSQFSWAVTKVSKKRQVLRAAFRRKTNCSVCNAGTGGSKGWLIRHAIHGATNQRPRIGAASGNWWRCTTARKHPLARATTGVIHMVL